MLFLQKLLESTITAQDKVEKAWVRLRHSICWESGEPRTASRLCLEQPAASCWRSCRVSCLPGVKLCALVVTQSLSLSDNNYSAYPGKTLIFTWKPLNCTLLHIMYTKLEINKWCYSSSQALLLCLACASLLLCGLCSGGGLHLPSTVSFHFLAVFPWSAREFPAEEHQEFCV